jgi:hypothetical protein
MRNLKKIFENDNSEFDFTEDDIIDIFNDFEDEGYKIMVRFGKRLHQFHEIDSKVTDQDIKLGFKLSIWVNLVSSYMDSIAFSRSEKYLNLLNEVQYRLNTLNLYIKEVEKSKNQINILIYTK